MSDDDFTWHYQLIKHTYDFGDPVYSVHEYYPLDSELSGWTENPVSVSADSAEEVKEMLLRMISDIDKYGVQEIIN